MKYGFIKAAAATPLVRAADCEFNTENIINQIREAHSTGAALIVFPELCVTGYTCSDLFLQRALLEASENSVKKMIYDTSDLDIISVVGVPFALGQSLYNCSAVIYKGRLLGISPKINIPNYGEFYEARHFVPGKDVVSTKVSYAGNNNVTFGKNIIYTCKNIPEFTFAAEICEDLWVPCSPSETLAVGGANIICNLSCSDDTIGKAAYRRELVRMQSGKLVCGYIFADAGFGESTTDMIFSGHNIIAENALLLAESSRFGTGIVYGDIDVQRISGERRRMNTYPKECPADCLRVDFDYEPKHTELSRTFARTPFVPSDKSDLNGRCREIITMQSSGLAVRLSHTGIKHVVLGLSGGLDSTLALIVCAHAFDMLKISRENIHTVTMPCFGTTTRTKSNAHRLAEAYGTSLEEINITDAVLQHFGDIGHNREITDVTYENSQARERTQILMDLSNKYGGLVIGTGDLSELALGWATYNGDHMSMYAVNASVPKTLVRCLVSFEADVSEAKLKTVLLDILDTPVSPELLPPDESGSISQKTEDVVGPYELHDFFLYYAVRFGFTPSKIYYLANIAFKEKYGDEIIKKWLKTFFRRFFSQQFKRSCLPDGPKVGSVTLSPRSDWRMPSDASSRVWLSELEEL